MGINVDGAGVRLAPVAVYANRVAAGPPGACFTDGETPIPAGRMNISVVDRRSDDAPATAYLSHPCRLWSSLSTDAP